MTVARRYLSSHYNRTNNASPSPKQPPPATPLEGYLNAPQLFVYSAAATGVARPFFRTQPLAAAGNRIAPAACGKWG